jgi:predicted nucleic acid-binding protein
MNRPFFDTSILVAGLIDFGESSRASIELLDRVADQRIPQAATAWHCCLEFYSVATRLPEEYRLPIETAQQFVDEEIIARLGVEILTQTDQNSFFHSTAHNGIRGGRVYDFHIGMIALTNSASVIVTENKKHFSLFERQGLPVLNSDEFIQALR